MKWKPYGISVLFACASTLNCIAHDIVFCGERIPVHKDFIADKLMNVIRGQVPNVNLPQLRRRVEQNFPIVEYYLRETGLPEDFKYLAVVESGFRNLTSSAGARGFWQLMPETARELGLTVNETVDERDNIYKSTYAACKVLASYYLGIKKKYGLSSWVLTAAAYNFGIGNMSSAINRQGKDYFSMDLNPETALYVYKIIAVKELFEYPELYMKDFGYNVFNVIRAGRSTGNVSLSDSAAFTQMVVKVNADNTSYPDKIHVKEPLIPGSISAKEAAMDRNNFQYLAAGIKGKYKNFEDGQLITIRLFEDLTVRGSYYRKGSLIKGKGWIIGDRVFIDLGYRTHEVSLLDVRGKKGVSIEALKNNEPILLRINKNKSEE
jgi:membrane-bound lytic murein transglycosylase D